MRRIVAITAGIMIAAVVAPAAASQPRVVYLCNGEVATHVGTIGDDTIRGTGGDDVIVGRGGNDTIIGNGGSDVLCGDAGNDRLFGGDGFPEILIGGPGDDLLNGGTWDPYGNGSLVPSGVASYADGARAVTVDLAAGTATGAGTDTLRNIAEVIGTAHNDVITGGSGDDWLKGGPGRDTIDGGPGSDVIYGGDDKDLLFGGTGDDTVAGGLGNDVIEGGGGHDRLYGCDDRDACPTDVRDRINGGLGNDFVDGDYGDDILNGGGGSDELRGGPGADVLVGRVGYDIAFGAEDARSIEVWASGEPCQSCDTTEFDVAAEKATLSVYPYGVASTSYWFEASGTFLVQNPGSCPLLTATVEGSEYAPTSHKHHYFYVACASRPVGAYQVTCTGTTECTQGEHGGWILVTDRPG